jgi:hypothetical protein
MTKRAWRDFGEVQWAEDTLGALHGHVVNCHLHDNQGFLDTHILPGQGSVDWKKIMPQLKSCPRLKCIQSEVIPLRTKTPIRTLCDTFRKLMEI